MEYSAQYVVSRCWDLWICAWVIRHSKGEEEARNSLAIRLDVHCLLPFLTRYPDIMFLFSMMCCNETKQRPSFVSRMSVESLEDKLFSDAPEKRSAAVKTAPAPAPAAAPVAAAPASAPPALLGEGFDVPVIPVLGVIAAAFAAATFTMRSGKDDREAEQSAPAPAAAAEESAPAPAEAEESAPAPAEAEESAPAPAEAEESAPAPAAVDISIPYDAAAQLAYEESDKSMEYSKFKTKYEADSVEDVKAKQK
jgi:hypothetical protein